MNYDTFRDMYTMEFHGKVYDVILNLHQYRDKETKINCVKVEVHDPNDGFLKTIYAPANEFKFTKQKRKTCGECLSYDYDNECCCLTFKDAVPERASCRYFEECDV